MDAREAVERLAPACAMLAAIVAARARALARAMYGAMTTNALVSGGLMFTLSRWLASVGRALARRAVVAVDRAVFVTFVVSRGACEEETTSTRTCTRSSRNTFLASRRARRF